MTCSYAGVSFENDLTGQDGMVPRWSRQALISRRAIPFSNREDVQSVGLGNARLTLLAYLEDDAGVAALQAAQGATRRTLSNPFGDGVTYSNVMLVEVGDPVRKGWRAEWEISLAFERIS